MDAGSHEDRDDIVFTQKCKKIPLFYPNLPFVPDFPFNKAKDGSRVKPQNQDSDFDVLTPKSAF